MNKADILDLKKILSNPKKVVIVPHKNPDGDAMGSTLGLCNYLKKLGHSGKSHNLEMDVYWEEAKKQVFLTMLYP